MNRKVSSIAAAALMLGAISANDPISSRLMGVKKTTKRKLWTCRKCGEKFYPNISNSLCDECIKRRDGVSI